MRRLVPLLLVLGACDLYFGPSADPGESRPDARVARPTADARPPADAGPPNYTFATCEDGVIHRSLPQPADVAPADIAAGFVVTSCASRCRSPGEVYECLGDGSCAGAERWLCEPDLSCPGDASCAGSPARACSVAAGCAVEVETETCACTGTSCTSVCADGLCSPVQVLHAIAGHWQGTVTPPPFSGPYQVELVIAADGHLATRRIGGGGPAFYYGEDGAHPDRWFDIVGETPDGAVGQVGVMFAPDEILPGLITGLRVEGNHLSFRFWDSWLDCSRPFDFKLVRIP
jgi:hypothetical protein